MVKALLGQLALAGAAMSAIVVATSTVEPVYVGRAPVVERLVGETWRDTTAARAPWAVAHAEVAMRMPQFEADRQAFAADLRGTGRIGAARADSIALVAVREAYVQKVPPALVFGVLLTENATFRSSARSNVGAVGLMQIYPKYWVPTLGRKFGRDLRDDETNLRYGVHILAHYVYTSVNRVAEPTPDAVLSKGLLRYNGCVKGTNTKGCHRYPDKVLDNVERYAKAQCGVGVAECVAKPIQVAMETRGR